MFPTLSLAFIFVLMDEPNRCIHKKECELWQGTTPSPHAWCKSILHKNCVCLHGSNVRILPIFWEGSCSHHRIWHSPFTLKHATMISGVPIEIKSCSLSIHVRCVGNLCFFYVLMSHAGHGSWQDPAVFFFAATFSFRMATLRRNPILPRLTSGISLLQHDVAVPFLHSK